MKVTSLLERDYHSPNRQSQPTNTQRNVFFGPLVRTGLSVGWCWYHISDRTSNDCGMVKMWGTMLEIQSAPHIVRPTAEQHPTPDPIQCSYYIDEILTTSHRLTVVWLSIWCQRGRHLTNYFDEKFTWSIVSVVPFCTTYAPTTTSMYMLRSYID